VHFLLLKGTKHPVSAFYPNLSGVAHRTDDPYPSFRSFCLERAADIRRLISLRLVQTNEVRRAAALLPAFTLVSRRAPRRPISFIEIGASAGLNLLWDFYGYDYGEGRLCGDMSSPVRIACRARGIESPPLPETMPQISKRIGIDLNPIDACDPDETLWLRALVWSEHQERAELLRRAIQIAKQHRPMLISGDAAGILPSALALIPPESALCIFRIFTQLSPESRGQLADLISQQGAKRDLFLISAKPHGGSDSELQLVAYVNGFKTEKSLAYFENHGEWIEWLAGDTN